MKPKYFKLLKESWYTIWKHPVAFSPIIYFYIASTALFLIALFSGLAILGPDLSVTEENFVHASIFFLITGLVTCFLLVHTSAFQIAVMNKIARKKSTTIGKSCKESAKLYWRTFGVSIIKLLLFIVPAALIGLYSSHLMESSLGSIGKTFLLIIVGGGILFLLGSWFLFVPAMLPVKKGVWKLFKQGWTHLLKDTRYVFLILLLQLATTFLFTLPFLLFSTYQESLTYKVIYLIVNTILLVWTTLFVYKAYYTRYT